MESAVPDALGVRDGVTVGEAVALEDGVGEGVAKALPWPGRHTTSTIGGHISALQFQAPYSVLPAQEPEPVHEMLQRPGMAGRVQNMVESVHESVPEQFTTALSCKMKGLLPDKPEQLYGPWQLMVSLKSGREMGQR